MSGNPKTARNMGLRTTHNCFEGSYTGFHEFRYALARQIGIDLDEYIGFGELGTKELSTIQHDVAPLLMHSDCDGELSVGDCERVAKGIDSVLENFNPILDHAHYFQDELIMFRDGCLKAVSKNEPVEFS